MIFPVSVRFKRTLKAIVTPDNKEQILEYLKESILEKKADNVAVGDMSVNYKGSISNWRSSLFGSVDDGIFYLANKENNWILYYRINMRKLFIGTAIIAIALGGYSLVNDGPWWIGIAMFLWLCGGNWIIILIRHDIVINDIALGVNELICGKTELPEEDKMNGKLKSWF